MSPCRASAFWENRPVRKSLLLCLLYFRVPNRARRLCGARAYPSAPVASPHCGGQPTSVLDIFSDRLRPPPQIPWHHPLVPISPPNNNASNLFIRLHNTTFHSLRRGPTTIRRTCASFFCSFVRDCLFFQFFGVVFSILPYAYLRRFYHCNADFHPSLRPSVWDVS